MTGLLLAVSTSSTRGSVAVLRDHEVLARVAYEGGTAHAERLFAAIDAAMEEAGASRGELAALACDVGPGSFTGVRVGVSACQGIAVGLGLPAIGIGSLDAMAFAARARHGADAAVLAVLDARKGEVFAALVAPTGESLWGPLHLPRERAAAEMTDAVRAHAPAAIVVGQVVTELVTEVVTERVTEQITERVTERVTEQVTERAAEPEAPGAPLAPHRDPSFDLPDAVAVGRYAALRLAADGPGPFDAASLEPVYVRAPDARPLADAPSAGGPV